MLIQSLINVRCPMSCCFKVTDFRCKNIFPFLFGSSPLRSFAFSLLTPLQRMWPDSFPKEDFAFWVKYGSWSFCPSCRSFFFNDKYFKERVYLNTATSMSPEAMAAHRRSTPDDPIEHASGSVGVSSRWWYLPGMYRPQQQCGRCTPVLQQTTGQAFASSHLGVLRRGMFLYMSDFKRTRLYMSLHILAT
jgi:hypothetical protein